MANTNKNDVKSVAIQNAIAFLRKKINSGRYGLACLGLNGQPKFSNDKGHLFSIFHLVNALGEEMNEIERTIFLTRIISEKYEDQWGYSPRGYYKQEGENPFFVDADDTSFALRTLRSLNIYHSNDILLEYLSSFQHNNKSLSAFTTFKFKQPGRQLVNKTSFDNNAHIHAEVNANVYHVLLDSHNDKLINFELVKLAQKEDGSWSSYFYPNPYYSTWQFMSLLTKMNQTNNLCFSSGLSFLANSQAPDGSWGTIPDAYYSALALKTLALSSSYSSEKEKALDFLLSYQKADGAWNTHEKIWTFHDADDDIWQAYDSNNVICTAMCIDALKSL